MESPSAATTCSVMWDGCGGGGNGGGCGGGGGKTKSVKLVVDACSRVDRAKNGESDNDEQSVRPFLALAIVVAVSFSPVRLSSILLPVQGGSFQVVLVARQI